MFRMCVTFLLLWHEYDRGLGVLKFCLTGIVLRPYICGQNTCVSTVRHSFVSCVVPLQGLALPFCGPGLSKLETPDHGIIRRNSSNVTCDENSKWRLFVATSNLRPDLMAPARVKRKLSCQWF